MRPITTSSSSLHGHKKTVDIVGLSKLLQQKSSAQQDTVNNDTWIQEDLEMHLQNVEPATNNNNLQDGKQGAPPPIKIIFSDIDGSLIHYPKSSNNNGINAADNNDDTDNEIIYLPSSATGMRGIISSKTLALCNELRTNKGVKLVLVTGARTSTLLSRLPYLPKADVYCTESGGRIFYPTNVDDGCCFGEENDDGSQQQFTYTPVNYSGRNIKEDDYLQSFGLREDMTWRKRMELGGAGIESYSGNNIMSNRCHDDDGSKFSYDEECSIDYESIQNFPIVQDVIPISQRTGQLWDYANYLISEEKFVLDTKSYSTSFRVNRKHQVNDRFDALLSGEIDPHSDMMIGKSTNLGCIDFYPVVSGKQNW